MSTYATTQGSTETVDATLITRCCSECSVVYAIPTRMYDRGKNAGKGWYCPNGHWQVPMGRTTEQKLEDERARSGRLAAQRDQAEASRRAQAGAATRARRERDRLVTRAKAGVCPCCNRTFKQLARHMKSKHPDYEGPQD